MTNTEKLLSDCLHEDRQNGLELKEAYSEFQKWFVRYRNGDKSLDPNLNGMIEYNLSEDEAFYILAYTGRCSGWINSNLREGLSLDSKCKEKFANHLEMALDKMPPANEEIVYRMDNPCDVNEIMKWFSKHIGKKFQIPYFLSTAKFDYKNSEVVWKIRTLQENSNGKDISDLTNSDGEKEVLFKRNSCFKIISVDRPGKLINLVEIPATINCDFLLAGSYHRNIP